MLRDFNLIATTYRGLEHKARYELTFLLEQIGESTPNVDRSGIAGLIVAKTAQEPLEVVKKLREILHNRPYEFRYLLRLVPIEKVVRTDLEEIAKAAEEFGSEMGKNETFRVTVEKRFTKIHSHEIIEAVATKIKRKVNLEKPDKVFLVEVVGGYTGVSMINPDGMLSVLKEKML